jgi:hypothetical protein
VQGSISYARGYFADAIEQYRRYVEARWKDLDAWRLLGAALRRGDRLVDALAVAFDVDQLQRCDLEAIRREWGSRWPFHLEQIVSKRSQFV